MEAASSLLHAYEVSQFQQLLIHLDTANGSTYTQLLDDAIQSCRSSYLPLLTLYAICSKRARPWPVLELLGLFWTCWRLLPESTKAGQDQRARALIDTTLLICNNALTSINDLLHPSSPQAALINPENGLIINHITLARLVSTFSLPITHRPSAIKPVVAISLPNGMLLALTVLATATYYTAVPVGYGVGVGAEQFKRDVLESGSSFILASAADVDRLRLHDSWIRQAGIQVLLVELSDRLELVFRDLDRRRVDTATQETVPNRAGDIAVLFFTSGTTGNRKLVPIHTETLVTGAAMVKESWGLSAKSRCLNQMPLNHVGGVVRNLFAPLISAGSVICCTSFDPHGFWDAVDDFAPNWYYAAPTMHQCILETAAERPQSVAKSQIKLICNAAGALLPALATQLRDTFSRPGLHCAVLPSYGMTECMPITTPPLSYQLQKPGTSGISVGPEIAILDPDDRLMRAESTGRIAVRGAPLFAGYLKDGQLDRTCFTKDGWFDTGDLGYLDSEGYLYLTSRSKEVINRGGELISPFEVEEAVIAAAKDPTSCLYNTISRALAFSTKHDLLQEVVGLLVEVPADQRRPCLKMVHDAVKASLAAAKIPVLIVYMNGMPTNNNKVLRIRLAERMSLPTLSDATPQSQRYFEAICPPPNTPLTTSIRCRPLPLSYRQLKASCASCIPESLDFHIRAVPSEAHPELWLAPKAQVPNKISWSDDVADQLRRRFMASLDAYCVPSKIECLTKPFTRNLDGCVDDQSLLGTVVPPAPQPTAWEGIDQTQTKVGIAFSETLNIPAHTLNESSNFFELGGDSLKAGRLLSALRKTFKIRLTVENLFTASTVGELAKLINDKAPTPSPQAKRETRRYAIKSLPGSTITKSSTNPLLLAVQLLPILIVAPMRRAISWTIFIYSFAFSQGLSTSETLPGRFFNLVVSLMLGKIFVETASPLIAIICKWLIIGRYREGLYPFWSLYHTRWWLVEKIISIGGLGIYKHSNFTLRLYYRLLGAKIGKGVVIDKTAKLGECDLLTIGDNVVLDPACTIRAFAAERNTSMYLGRIRIGANASIGLASIVAAGSSVPPSTCIGPNSSSWELNSASEENRDLSPSKISQPDWTITYLVGLPLAIATSFIGAIPWMVGLFPLIVTEPKQDSFDTLRETIIWFSGVQRVIWHYIALGLHASLGPVFFFFGYLAIKRCLDAACGGPLQAGSEPRSQLDMLRMLLMRKLMPDKQFHKLTGLFGTHYEMTSICLRMLGSKIGKHIYWPGKGPTTQDWDMLEVGDHVVFGSRAYIVTSDGYGTAQVKIGDGAMVADRVVLLPGSDLGTKTVMGSGALARRDKEYPSETTWVGSRANDSICLKAQPTTTALEEPTLGIRNRQYRDTIDGQISLYNYYMNASEISLPRPHTDSRVSSMCDLDPYYEEVLSKEKPSAIIHEIPVEADQDEEASSSPFARAFYENKATYRVWSQTIITCYSIFLTIFTAVFWNVHSISAIQIVAWVFMHPAWHGFLDFKPSRPLVIYIFFSCLIACIMAVQIIVALGIVIASKWALMGRRMPGNYDWDKSPYCQRWQLFLKMESLRQQCYGGNGILGLLTGTHWIVMYFRALGAKIEKDCALFASGTPSLYFTEPDLLTLGDRVSVDNASLVCHINTRGKFDLNPLVVGDRSVLRTGSRLLSGAKMEADSCLLEHTLVMAGDVVDAETARQGWPSEEFDSNRLPTLKVDYHWVRA